MMKRQLAAILYADVTEYSRLTGLDEEGTHKKLNAGLNLLDEVVIQHGGVKVHEAGDAILSEFESVTAAVNCAAKFQNLMTTINIDLTDDERLQFRIGINLGEIIRDRDDIYGDGVNLTARIQELADPGGVCVSGAVYEQGLGLRRGTVLFGDERQRAGRDSNRHTVEIVFICPNVDASAHYSRLLIHVHLARCTKFRLACIDACGCRQQMTIVVGCVDEARVGIDIADADPDSAPTFNATIGHAWRPRSQLRRLVCSVAVAVTPEDAVLERCL